MSAHRRPPKPLCRVRPSVPTRRSECAVCTVGRIVLTVRLLTPTVAAMPAIAGKNRRRLIRRRLECGARLLSAAHRQSRRFCALSRVASSARARRTLKRLIGRAFRHAAAVPRRSERKCGELLWQVERQDRRRTDLDSTLESSQTPYQRTLVVLADPMALVSSRAMNAGALKACRGTIRGISRATCADAPEFRSLRLRQIPLSWNTK